MCISNFNMYTYIRILERSLYMIGALALKFGEMLGDSHVILGLFNKL